MSTIIEQDQARKIRRMSRRIDAMEEEAKELMQVYRWLLLGIGIGMYLVGKL